MDCSEKLTHHHNQEMSMTYFFRDTKCIFYSYALLDKRVVGMGLCNHFW